MTSCWLNGQLVAREQATVSVFDHGLLYGDGVFEGIRFYHRQAFRLARHLQRLYDSAQAIGLTIPYTQKEMREAIEQTIQEYVRSTTQCDGYLRVVVTRGIGPLGLDPSKCVKATTFIIADQLGFVDDKARQQGVRLIIAATRRLPADGLDPRIKSLNYLNHTLARMEASDAQADEAILLNQQGKVTEGSTDNIFIVKNTILYTPPVSDGALDGITRAVVLELATMLGIEHRERSMAAYDLYTADECFLTGTGVELIPVREIDGRAIVKCPGPIFKRLQAAFVDCIARESNVLAKEAASS